MLRITLAFLATFLGVLPQDEKPVPPKIAPAPQDERPAPPKKPTQPELVTELVPDSLPDPTHPGLAEPTAKARRELGEKLFFDPILSLDRTISCGSCHKREHGFADDVPFSLGVKGQKSRRNSPSLINRYLGNSFMWDGRFRSLEEQAVDPINNPEEMALGTDEAIKRLRASEEYRALFAKAWPEREIEVETLAGSLAHFVRYIRLGDSPIDRFRFGDGTVLSPLEKRGLWLYESRAQCWRCHFGPDFSDEFFHNTGVGAKDGKPEPGRFAVTKQDEDRGRFKTPTLRGVAHTAPYMHDGSLATLRDVVEHYRRGGIANDNLSPDIRKLALSDADVDALVAFLKALSRTD
ncbi:MAG: cytochrome c peroxidase [Planctomycetota bacterium]